MTGDISPSPSTQPRSFLFSIGSMLLLVAVVCLATALVHSNRKLAQTERKLSAFQPLPAKEVARQFKKCTTLGPISTTVKDVRFSPTDNAYKVDFSWVNATTGKTWSTDVKLSSNGYGAYFGRIHNGPFIKPLGHKDGFTVAVETPSPFKQ